MRRLLLFVVGSIFWVVPAQAANEFYTKYDVNYVFDSLGQAQVEQNVFLTNKQSNLYAASYQLTLQGDPPGQITGHDSKGPLKITTDQPRPDTTVVKIIFNDQIVGKDNTLHFTLSYTARPASHNGQIWEISLPRIGSAGQIDAYNLHLKVPDAFGQLAFISPSPAATGNHQYDFTKEQVSRAGVVAAFGNFQTFNFAFKYALVNSNSRPALAEVALPADTNYQRVKYSDLMPRPSDITVDPEGNWLAHYRVPPHQTITVTTSGQAHLLADPTKTQPGLTPSQKQAYLQPTTYWPSTDSHIQSLAKQLKTPEAIYNYVVQTLKYDYNLAKPGATRKGAATALQQPTSSICTEFTDLFISLARAAGIPAREVNGFAYTTDKHSHPLSLVTDVFHAWPQYWDEKTQTWISIDPTWGNTTGGIDYFHKLDFNHFAFITRGLSDNSPVITSEDVHVDYGTYQEITPGLATLSFQPPTMMWPHIANTGVLTVANPAGLALYRLPLFVSAHNLKLVYQGPTEVEVLPPFTSRQYPLSVYSKFWPDFSPKSVSAVLGNQSETYNMNAKLFLAWQIILGITIATSITTLGWLAAKAWGIYLQRRLRAGSLRR